MPAARHVIRAEEAPIGSHLPLAFGWDTIVEVYDLFPKGIVQGALEAWKEVAAMHAGQNRKEPWPVTIAGRDFWLWPVGLQRWPWILGSLRI